MNWSRPRFLQRSFAAIACQFASIGLLTVSVWSTSGPTRQQDQMSPQYKERMRTSVKEFKESLKLEDLKVLNKTRKFELVNIEKVNTQSFMLQLTLKNGYKKGITAFSFGVGAVGPSTSPDLAESEIESESRIPPGGTTIEYSGISLSGLRQLQNGGISIPREQNLFITIYAVIFDDKTAEGDPRAIAQMLDVRASQKKVVTLKNALLQKVLDSRDLDLDSLATPPELVLDRFRSDFSSLIQETVETDNRFKDMSATSLREEIADWLNDLDNRLRSDSSTSLRKRIIQIKKTQEQILSRL